MPQAVVLELVGENPPLYPTKYAHGLFFALLSRVNPDLAQRLHGAPRKPFTLAPLPGKGTLFAPFHHLRRGPLCSLFSGPPRGCPLEGLPQGWFLPAGACPGHSRESPLGRGRFLGRAQGGSAAGEGQPSLPHPHRLRHLQARGAHPLYPLPDPRLIASSLLDKWQAYSPFAYNPKEEAALRELFAMDLELADFRNLRFHRVQAGKGFFPGFTGEVTLRLWSEAHAIQGGLRASTRPCFLQRGGG